MKNIVLFDLDGTLTPPRESMDENMLEYIEGLQRWADIGIVTGSPFQYISEQAPEFLRQFDYHEDGGVFRIMPCNGTQLYVSTGFGYKKVHEANMKETLGTEAYRRLIWVISNLQVNLLEGIDIPLSGNFISYRGSMLNWCMIGRDATSQERKAFVGLDTKFQVRTKLSQAFSDNLKEFKLEGIEHAIGGNTSIDVYPTGWDKRYALNHIQDYDNIYFVGDRCDPGGNDYSLYQVLDEDKRFKTTGPAQTKEIIGGLIEKLANNDKQSDEP